MALLPPASSQFYEPLPPCSSSAAIAGRLLPSLEPQCVARSPSPLELPGLGARTEVTERDHDKAVPRARRQTSTRNRSSTLSGPNLVLGTPFMGTFGSSSQPCEASEYPTKQERRSSGDAVSNTRKSGSFDPAGPTSDDEEERRGRRLLRPSATSSTCNPSRSRTPSKRTSRKPPKRWLSPDGKGTPCDCAETLASSPATIASPGSPPTDFTSPRHFSVLPQSPPHTDPLPTHLQQGPSTRTEFDSLNPIPKYRRRQSIVSEHLARFVESRTPSSSDPQQSPPSSPPRAVRFQRRYSVSIPPQDAERSGSATPLDQGPVVGEKDRSHSGSSSSIASSLLSRYFSLDSSRAGSTSSESDSTFLPTTSYGDPDEEERGVFCSSPEELHPPPPSAFLTSAWSSLTSLSALSFASTSIVTSQQVPEIGEQNTAVARNCRKRSGHASWPPSPPSSPETNADSGIAAQTSSRLSNWSSIRSIHVRFRPCALSLDNSDANAGAGAADDADATVNAFTLRIQDLALQQQQQQAVTNPTAASLFLHSPTGLSTMPSRWPRVETCVGSPPLIKIEYWSGRKKEVVPQGVDLDQLLDLVLTPFHRT